MNKLSYLSAVALLCIPCITSAKADKTDKTAKIDICHYAGNGRIVVLTVPEKSAEKHKLNHGDFTPFELYACPEDGDCSYGDPELGVTMSCVDELEGYSPNLKPNLETADQVWQTFQPVCA
jgi:hypothetical protein